MSCFYYNIYTQTSWKKADMKKTTTPAALGLYPEQTNGL